MRRQPLLAFFGHHKCASTWIEQICGAVSHDLGLRFRIVYTEEDFDPSLARLVDREDVDFLAYANAHYRHVAALGDVRGFHVVRDPRDIVVSAYFSHLHSHPTDEWPELVEHRARLQSASKEEGLLIEMEFRAQQFEEMMSWPAESPAGILRVRMEELTADPYQRLLELFSFLELLEQEEHTAARRTRFFLSKVGAKVNARTGLPMRWLASARIPPERLLGIAWENRFSRHAGGRREGQEDVKSHYRKGVAGDWLNHFTRQHLEFFGEHYTDVLLQYGYETDADWDRRYADDILDA